MKYKRHSVHHRGICNPISVKLLQLMSGVIMHNLLKKNEVSILINGWVIAKYSFSRPPFCLQSWNLSSDLCQTSTTNMRYRYAHFSKNEVSTLINGWVTANYCVSRPPFCPPEFVIQFVSNSYRLCPVLFHAIKKKWGRYLKPFSWGPQTRHTHTHAPRKHTWR